MRRIGLTLLLVCAVALSGAFAFAASAPPPPIATDSTLVFEDHGVRLTNVSAAPGDTQTVVARWGAATNSLGSADAYRVVWRLSVGATTGRLERVVNTLDDRVAIPMPALPDSVKAVVAVWAMRRGLVSVDSAWATRWFKRADAPPPPPGPVILDTLAMRPDSVRLFASKSNLYYNDGAATFPVGSDTALMCAVARSSTTGTWHLTEYGVVVRGTGQDTLQIANVVHFPTAECTKVVSQRNGPAISSGFYPVQWSTPAASGSNGGEDHGASASLSRLFKIT